VREDDVRATPTEVCIAALLGPFAVLPGQDRANEADKGAAAGRDADHIGPSDQNPRDGLVWRRPTSLCGSSRLRRPTCHPAYWGLKLFLELARIGLICGASGVS
jgi:hypothetical protein